MTKIRIAILGFLNVTATRYANILWLFFLLSVYQKRAQFCKSPCTFFRTKTDPQNTQEPHQISVFKKTTSKTSDGNSLPYYQEGRKGGLHPPFRVPSAPSFPPAFCAPYGRRFFIALFGFG